MKLLSSAFLELCRSSFSSLKDIQWLSEANLDKMKVAFAFVPRSGCCFHSFLWVVLRFPPLWVVLQPLVLCVVLLSPTHPFGWWFALLFGGTAFPPLLLWAVLLWVVLRSYPSLVWCCFRLLGGAAFSSFLWGGAALPSSVYGVLLLLSSLHSGGAAWTSPSCCAVLCSSRSFCMRCCFFPLPCGWCCFHLHLLLLGRVGWPPPFLRGAVFLTLLWVVLLFPSPLWMVLSLLLFF